MAGSTSTRPVVEARRVSWTREQERAVASMRLLSAEVREAAVPVAWTQRPAKGGVPVGERRRALASAVSEARVSAWASVDEVQPG